jgi:hypothetical protein
MVEKRAFPRHRLLKVGTIEFDGGAINCMVRNLSTAGAALDVASPVEIPEHFVLVADGSHLPCSRHLAERKTDRRGLRIDEHICRYTAGAWRITILPICWPSSFITTTCRCGFHTDWTVRFNLPGHGIAFGDLILTGRPSKKPPPS